MWSRLTIGALLACVALPPVALAQDPSGPERAPVPLEIRRGASESKIRRPIIRPEPQAAAAAREAERAVAEYERIGRELELVREQSRAGLRRPDLGYDVYSGIQQRNIQRSAR